MRIAHLEMMGRWKGVSEIHFLHCTVSASKQASKLCDIVTSIVSYLLLSVSPEFRIEILIITNFYFYFKTLEWNFYFYFKK